MNGRRGAVVHAIGAIDMALWDLKGQALGRPICELLGPLRPDPVVPYASLQPAGDSFEAYRDALCASAERAKALGFRAVKSEVTMAGPYAHSGLDESYDRHTEVVAAVRRTLGPEITLMVDVQYLWEDAATALSVVRDWAEFDLYFLETPIWPDYLDEYARLAERAPMPIAAGEWLATRYEFEELMDRGRIGVAQPDVGRVGGLSEARIVCAMAKERGLTIVPHCWKTGRVDLGHGASRLRHAALRLHRIPAAAALRRDAAQGAGRGRAGSGRRRDRTADPARPRRRAQLGCPQSL